MRYTPPADTIHAVETPEGIVLTLRPAGVVVRSLAYLIDLLIRGVVLTVVLVAAGTMRQLGWGLAALVWFGLEWLYPVVFEFWRGATPGKRVLGLRVVMDSGVPLTLAASVVRNLLRVVDWLPVLFGMGVVSILWRGDSKRLGDLAGGTLVVFERQMKLHADLPPADPRTIIPPGCPLTGQGQTAVIAWAGRMARLTPERVQELACIAQPALPHVAGQGQTLQTETSRLLGVAHWLLGHRAVGDGQRQA